jgi:aspartate carbamoyltransferase catalytic subunit
MVTAFYQPSIRTRMAHEAPCTVQVLTDLYTIQQELGTVDGLTFLCVGDVRMRTMHSCMR